MSVACESWQFRSCVAISFAVRAEPPSSCLLGDRNWKEFQRLVPAKIQTLIFTVATTLALVAEQGQRADQFVVPFGPVYSFPSDR
jgi:hypothetical protein